LFRKFEFDEFESVQIEGIEVERGKRDSIASSDVSDLLKMFGTLVAEGIDNRSVVLLDTIGDGVLEANENPSSDDHFILPRYLDELLQSHGIESMRVNFTGQKPVTHVHITFFHLRFDIEPSTRRPLDYSANSTSVEVQNDRSKGRESRRANNERDETSGVDYSFAEVEVTKKRKLLKDRVDSVFETSISKVKRVELVEARKKSIDCRRCRPDTVE